jgi:AraC-like DNA-binding protein
MSGLRQTAQPCLRSRMECESPDIRRIEPLAADWSARFADGKIDSVWSKTMAAAGVPMRRFFRAFRATTGLTPIAFIQSARVQRAIELFETEGAGVTEAAIRVGYSNLGYFTRIFARATGLTPSAYRRVTAGAPTADRRDPGPPGLLHANRTGGPE